ncbi:hypothetical protein [Colwellia sp. MEBiC06753]
MYSSPKITVFTERLFFIAVISALILAALYIDNLRKNSFSWHEKETIRKIISERSKVIEEKIYRAISYSVASRSLVLHSLRSKKALEDVEFAIFSETLLADDSFVIGLQLAPDGVICFWVGVCPDFVI